MYTKSAIIAALTGLATAAPAPAINKFAMIALHSTSPIQGAQVDATDRGFFIGKPSSGYCPKVNNLDCTQYQGETTVLSAQPGVEGGLSLAVSVPGGQQVFVEKSGALGYTGPHSATIPKLARLVPFHYNPQRSAGTVGNLKFEGKDWKACPTGIDSQYQIFAEENTIRTSVVCIGITLGTAEWAGKTAWEYS